jgi:predicted flap endonuclease-1-like 5' DNA nuclease
MPSHEPLETAGGTGSVSDEGYPHLELDEVHELQDHEFTLELELDETIEIPSGPPAAPAPLPARTPVPLKMPLPRWAAASRALLDSWQELLEVNAETTLEIPPPGSARAAAESDQAEISAREKLARLAIQMHAREVYCQEIERALVAAAGRVRGQAFRIAELEAELHQAETPRASTTEPEQRDDLQRIRGIGPRFALRLAELGVTSFESVANWTAADVTRMAEQLGIRRERITRDSWIRQAQALRGRRTATKPRAKPATKPRAKPRVKPATKPRAKPRAKPR